MPRPARVLGAALAAAALAPAAPAAAAVHLVAPGETLSGIAAANGLPASAVAAANGLAPDAFVISGRTLTIPAPGTTPAQAATSPATTAAGGYVVRPGDTLSGIAAAHGVSAATLAAANGLNPTAFVISGSRLRLPTGAGTVTAAAPGTGAPAPLGAYKVRPGDTLSGLAAQSRVPVAQMAYMNGLNPDAPLIAGTVIKLPTGSPVRAATPAPQATIVPSAAPAATPGRVTAAQIGQIAAQQGVPGSLASAIAWQESGFNNGMVSSANARGVMQIMPGTWDWVQSKLTSSPLDPASPTDNVKAGSLYLGQLLRETNGDPAMAAAGYYQGLASVRRIGMLPETQRYVANVLALRGRFGG